MQNIIRTKSGIEIGSNYFPDMRPTMSADEERIQAALLGIRTPLNILDVVDCMTYAVAVFVVVTILMALVRDL